LAHALVEAQQSEADDRGTRNKMRCEVDGIEGPNRVAGKWLPRTINYLGRDSQHLPMSRSGSHADPRFPLLPALVTALYAAST